MTHINVTIRIVHLNKSFEIKTDPEKITGDMILDQFVNKTPGLDLPKLDPEKNPIIYQLTSKMSGNVVGTKNLKDAGVKEFDTLLIVQKLIAGV